LKFSSSLVSRTFSIGIGVLEVPRVGAIGFLFDGESEQASELEPVFGFADLESIEPVLEPLGVVELLVLVRGFAELELVEPGLEPL